MHAKFCPGSLTTMYKYDEAGRLVTLITPTGSLISFSSQIREDGYGLKHFSVSASNSGKAGFDNYPHVITIKDKDNAIFSQGTCN